MERTIARANAAWGAFTAFPVKILDITLGLCVGLYDFFNPPTEGADIVEVDPDATLEEALEKMPVDLDCKELVPLAETRSGFTYGRRKRNVVFVVRVVHKVSDERIQRTLASVGFEYASPWYLVPFIAAGGMESVKDSALYVGGASGFSTYCFNFHGTGHSLRIYPGNKRGYIKGGYILAVKKW